MIIGISGKIGSGKSTVGEIIRELGGVSKNSVDWQIMRFAGKLKERIAVTWGLNTYQLEDQEFKKQLSPLGITWRELMQKEGEKMREIDEDYWVKALMSHYKTPSLPDETTFITDEKAWIETRSPKWLITDLRYPNEAKAIKDKGGILLRINRDMYELGGEVIPVQDVGTENIAAKYIIRRPAHHSETALDSYEDWSWVINNNGTIEELTEKVKQFLIKFNLI